MAINYDTGYQPSTTSSPFSSSTTTDPFSSSSSTGYDQQTAISQQITQLGIQSAMDQYQTAKQSLELTREANKQALWSMVAQQASAATTRANKLQQAMNQI
jgi:hypothetical protein